MIANYVEALTRAAPPRVVALSSMGANRTSGLGMITALSLLEQGFRDLASPIAFVRAGGFFENFLYGLNVAQGGTLPVYYDPTNRKSTMVAANDIGAEVATLLTGPAWPGSRIVELGSMVSADEVAAELGEVMNAPSRRLPSRGPAGRQRSSSSASRRARPDRPKQCSRPSTRAGWTLASRTLSTLQGRPPLAKSSRRPGRPRRRELRRSHQERSSWVQRGEPDG